MAFILRRSPRFPVSCVVGYYNGLSEGYGYLLDVSLFGFCFCGNPNLWVGQTCALTVNLPHAEGTFLPVGIVVVKWRLAGKYGVETVVTNNTAREQLAQYIKECNVFSGQGSNLRPAD
jgi:hypothetical protein